MCKPADRPTPEAVLAQRFAPHGVAVECDRCGRGAADHTVTFDRYGDAVVQCEAYYPGSPYWDDPEVVRAYNRRGLTGNLR